VSIMDQPMRRRRKTPHVPPVGQELDALRAKKIKEVQEHGLAAAGKTLYLKFLHKGSLTRGDAIHAFCYECQGYYSDGRADCEQVMCPLYAFHPYRGVKRSEPVEEGPEE